MAAATAFFLVQPVQAKRNAQAGPAVVSVPDGDVFLTEVNCLHSGSLHRFDFFRNGAMKPE